MNLNIKHTIGARSGTLFLFNTGMALFIGAAIDGLEGALMGIVVWSALIALQFLSRRLHSDLILLSRLQSLVRVTFYATCAIICLPLILLGGLIVAFIFYTNNIWGGIGTRKPDFDLRARTIAVANCFFHFAVSFVRPPALPLTIVNLLMLIVIGSVMIGIQVAFYVALSAVPVMLVTLVMVAIDSSAEPEDGPT